MARVIQVPGYRMVRALGRGGMGSVFLAEKTSTGEPFAIKFLRQDCMDDPSYLMRFEREVTSLRAIRHPNVVNVFAWSVPESPDSDDRPFVVMEYLDGEGLDRVLARERTFTPLTSVRIMLQVLDGLAAAHQVGVVHRDLGPSNVFLVPRQRGRFHVKILDFGLARSLHVGPEQSELTQQGTLMGKPAYVAPEALTGQAIDGRSDIFACGILLFRMLTGGFPYKESDSHLLWVERLRDARSETEYPSPSAVTPGIPESLDRITAKAMRSRVADRYASVELMQEELLEVEGELVGEHPSKADWSSSRPGIPALGEISVSDLRSRRRTSMVDSTPTVGAISAAALQRRRRQMVLLGGAAGAAVLVALVLIFVFRGGSGAAPGAAAAPPIVPAAAADAGLSAAAATGPRDVAEEVVAPEPDQTGPDVIGAADEALVDVAREKAVVVVRGAPKGATARLGSVDLSGDPPAGFVELGKGLELVVEARGWETYRETVDLEGDRELTVRLRRAERTPPPPPDRDTGTGVRVIPTVPEDPF